MAHAPALHTVQREVGLIAEAWVDPLPAGRASAEGNLGLCQGTSERGGTRRGRHSGRLVSRGMLPTAAMTLAFKGLSCCYTIFLNIEAQKASNGSTGIHLAASTKTPLGYIPFQSPFFLRRYYHYS